MDKIIYSTPEQQLEKLKSQNLIISDDQYAIEQLRQYGYSNLIKSYRSQYMIEYEGKKTYRDGTTFEQIESLYILDKNLRNAVMGAMLDLEEHIKEAAANVIAGTFGTHQDDYLQFKHYRDKKKRLYRFTLSGILDTMRKTLQTDKDPIAHYAQIHGIVPPWILFKSIYFSTIINFISLFKPKQQKMIANHLYDGNNFEIPDDSLVNIMMSTLFICLDYRNIAAHGGRVFDYHSNRNISLSLNNKRPLHGFSQLLVLLNFFKYHSPYSQLDTALTRELSRHCNRFPEDITYLGQVLNVNITVSEKVWISNNSKKYHRIRHCSGIKNAHSIDIKDAEAQGYIPCKRCCKNMND